MMRESTELQMILHYVLSCQGKSETNFIGLILSSLPRIYLGAIMVDSGEFDVGNSTRRNREVVKPPASDYNMAIHFLLYFICHAVSAAGNLMQSGCRASERSGNP
jgi:hypothetical protein